MAAGLLRLGFITAFLSRPVMDGFVFGLAIFVTVSQLPKLFGMQKGEGDTIRQFAHLISNLGDASVTTFAVGAVACGLLFALERYLPRVPGGLVVLVAGIAISAAANLSDHGVDTVGKIPSGLPSVVSEHITVSELWVLLPSAVGMMLVIFSEALGAGADLRRQARLPPGLQPGDDRPRPGQPRLGAPGRAGLRRQPVPDRRQRRRGRPLGAVAGRGRRVEPDHRDRLDPAVHRTCPKRCWPP